jgi:hypothetical protein
VGQTGLEGFYSFQYSAANGSTIQDLRYDGYPIDLGIIDYSADALGSRSWNISTERGLYPSNVGAKNSIVQKTGGTIGEYGARVKVGHITYVNGSVSPYIVQNIDFNHLNHNETDILIGSAKDSLSTRYYYLMAYEGEFYIIDVLQTAISSGIMDEIHLVGYTIPEGNITVSVAYFINEKWLEVYATDDNGQIKLFSGLYDMYDYSFKWQGGLNFVARDTYSFMDAAKHQPIEITTNNFDLDVLSVHLPFTVVRADPFSSGDWGSMAKMFALIMLWNVSGIPWEVNIIAIKLPLIAFALCCIAIAQGFIP